MAFPRHPSTKRHKVPERLQFFKEGLSGEPPDPHNVVLEQPVFEPKEKTPDDTRVSSEAELTNLPFIAPKRPNTSKPTGRYNIFIRDMR